MLLLGCTPDSGQANFARVKSMMSSYGLHAQGTVVDPSYAESRGTVGFEGTLHARIMLIAAMRCVPSY